MTHRVARALFPFSLAAAAAILAKGYAKVGDGFSAGAFAGLGAVVQYVCLDHEHTARVVGARRAWQLVCCGLLASLAVILGPALAGTLPATHAPPPGAHVAKVGVVELHTAFLFDAGIAVLVYGALVGTFDRLFPPLRGEAP